MRPEMAQDEFQEVPMRPEMEQELPEVVRAEFTRDEIPEFMEMSDEDANKVEDWVPEEQQYEDKEYEIDEQGEDAQDVVQQENGEFSFLLLPL